jgi:hypothetical protein
MAKILTVIDASYKGTDLKGMKVFQDGDYLGTLEKIEQGDGVQTREGGIEIISYKLFFEDGSVKEFRPRAILSFKDQDYATGNPIRPKPHALNRQKAIFEPYEEPPATLSNGGKRSSRKSSKGKKRKTSKRKTPKRKSGKSRR